MTDGWIDGLGVAVSAHRVIDWRHGGETHADNLTLLCRFHHREFASRGWAVHITNGHPEWTPPPWIDP